MKIIGIKDYTKNVFEWEYELRVDEEIVTGGPGGGKSTCLSVADRFFTKLGFIVIVGEEIVTRNVYSGIAPWDFDTETYQRFVISQMIHREEIFRKAAEELCKKYNKRVVIFYDRGLMDNLAYMPQEMLERILAEYDLTIPLVRERYDAVFHMVTPAIGAEGAYTTANNEARKDSLDEARELDYKTRNAWLGAPNFTLIDNSTGFEEKKQRFFDAVCRQLGVPVASAIERKFRVKKPNLEMLEGVEGVTKLEILQTYLRSENPDIERRIRQRGANGSYAYFYIERKNLPDGKFEEKERRLSPREYNTLLMEGEKSYRKVRYCFFLDEQCCDLDIYADSGEVIFEARPTEGETEVIIPDWIEVIEEVTSNPAYESKKFAK